MANLSAIFKEKLEKDPPGGRLCVQDNVRIAIYRTRTFLTFERWYYMFIKLDIT